MNMLLLSISCSCDEIRRGISVTVIQRAQSDVSACFIHYISQLELPDEAKVRDAARRRAGDAQETRRNHETRGKRARGWRRMAYSRELGVASRRVQSSTVKSWQAQATSQTPTIHSATEKQRLVCQQRPLCSVRCRGHFIELCKNDIYWRKKVSGFKNILDKNCW